MGINGLALANSIKDLFCLILTVIYSYCSKDVSKAIVPMNIEALRGWGEYFAISVPATVMLIAGWWAFEVIFLISGIIGPVEAASMTLITAYFPLPLMFAFGICEGTISLIGNSIGANNIPLAKRFYYLIGKISFAMILAQCMITLICRNQIVSAFTNS